MILDVTARLVASSCFIRQLNNAQIRQKYFILWRVEIMTIDKHILMCRHITDLMSIVDRVNALIENALLSPFNSTTFFVVMVRARHQNNNSNGGGRHQINHSLTQQLRHSLKQTARKKNELYQYEHRWLYKLNNEHIPVEHCSFSFVADHCHKPFSMLIHSSLRECETPILTIGQSQLNDIEPVFRWYRNEWVNKLSSANWIRSFPWLIDSIVDRYSFFPLFFG